MDPEDQVRSAGPDLKEALPWRGVWLGPQVVPGEVEKLRELRLVFLSVKISAVL